MWLKPQLFKEILACFSRRICRLLEFVVHIWMQIRVFDFPWVLCEQLLLLTWKLFYFPYLTIVFVWVNASLKPDVQHWIYFHYLTWSCVFIIPMFEAVTVGLCCTLHDLGPVQRPAGLPGQNTGCCKESMPMRHCLGYYCYEPLETKGKKI